jgi:hypothetical protein
MSDVKSFPKAGPFGKPSDPRTKECDWCGPGSQAEVVYEIYKRGKSIGTGQFLYACGKHRDLARENSRAPREAA